MFLRVRQYERPIKVVHEVYQNICSEVVSPAPDHKRVIRQSITRIGKAASEYLDVNGDIVNGEECEVVVDELATSIMKGALPNIEKISCLIMSSLVNSNINEPKGEWIGASAREHQMKNRLHGLERHRAMHNFPVFSG